MTSSAAGSSSRRGQWPTLPLESTMEWRPALCHSSGSLGPGPQAHQLHRRAPPLTPPLLLLHPHEQELHEDLQVQLHPRHAPQAQPKEGPHLAFLVPPLVFLIHVFLFLEPAVVLLGRRLSRGAEDGPPASTLCFGMRRRAAPVKKALLSVVGHGCGSRTAA
ncbi:hypothetical protein MUK42_14000 [Musa troglodytarum]|uniref:Uncharacterized protein n=1 Tax=Musa troglodytarum TaxID=320322 RepID=A0A9E7L4R5_9LILI|nr:hypothetical protein MUK42_14000 [Musa troglodytarum]